MSFLGLRTRLLGAFFLVAVPPLFLLASSLMALVSRSFEDDLDDRLATGAQRVLDRIATLRSELKDGLETLADQDLTRAKASAETDPTLAETLGGRRNLPALEILDEEGRVISSRHWPAGYGLPEEDRAFDSDLRLACVASGYSATERLALMPSHLGFFSGRKVTVRGGVFLDGDFLRDLSRLVDLAVAFRDLQRRSWIAPAGFPLETWSDPPPEGKGDVSSQGAPYRFLVRPVAPSLVVLVATPRTALETLQRGVLARSLEVAGASLALALLASLVLSARVARPVRSLADGARRVAQGDLDGKVEEASGDELGELGRAFNRMTEALRSSRERLLQAERVAAWREIAQRLAHDLKNPLFPIQLSIETLRRAFERSEKSPHGDLVRESTTTILEELAVLKRTIEDFGEFSRSPRPRPGAVDVNALVESVVSLNRPRGTKVSFETDLTPGLPPIEADSDLLHRALSNLVTNAIEAMPDGGAVRIATRMNDSTFRIEVKDSGPGLTAEQRARLFTPYFTTKKGGTGLGLAIVQGIVSDHGGRVEVSSTPGEGALFAIVLPSSGRQTMRSSTS